MARPRNDTETRPIAQNPNSAHVRLTRSRAGVNESAYARIGRIIREQRSLDDELLDLCGNINQAWTAGAESSGLRKGPDLNEVRSRMVDIAAEALAILACYE